MKLAELKARLVGRTIIDVDLSINEEMDAIQIGRITLDDGTQVSTEANHSPVWIDYLLVGPNETYITVSPDDSDRPVVDDEENDAFVFPPEVMLHEVLSTEEQASLLVQCWMSGTNILNQGRVLATHTNEPLPFRTMGGKNVTRWYELEWGMNGMTKKPNKTIIGIGTMGPKIHIVQGTRLKDTDDWSSVSTGIPA